MTAFAQQSLISFASRIERLDDEIKAMNADKTEVYAEMKGQGFDVKVFKVAYRRYRAHADDATTAQEGEALADLFLGGDGTKSQPAGNVAPANGHSLVRAHTREEYDPETGEIQDTESGGRTGAPVAAGAAGDHVATDAPAVTETPPPAVPPDPAAAPADDVASFSSSATLSTDMEIPAFLRRVKPGGVPEVHPTGESGPMGASPGSHEVAA